MSETFEEAIQPYMKELVRLAFTYVKDNELAEDIVQEVLIKAHKHFDQFRFEAKYKTYLYKMTINQCHDYFRSTKYLVIDKWITLLKNELSNEEKLLQKEQKYMLTREIFKLKPIYREVIVLMYYKDFSIKEIAYLLDISEDTVKTRLKRAKKKLRLQLEEGGITDEIRGMEA